MGSGEGGLRVEEPSCLWVSGSSREAGSPPGSNPEDTPGRAWSAYGEKEGEFQGKTGRELRKLCPWASL